MHPPEEQAMGKVTRFRNAKGELVSLEPIAATALKNAPGAVVDQAASGRAVVITRHDRPRAVIVSFEDFQALLRGREPGLGELEGRFEELLAAMQKPASKKAVNAAFAASPAQLGRAAAAAQRKPRKARRAG
jgi:prevent-host-death family protein